MISLSGRSLVIEMLVLKRDDQGVDNYRPLTNHVKVWAANSRPARVALSIIALVPIFVMA